MPTTTTDAYIPLQLRSLVIFDKQLLDIDTHVSVFVCMVETITIGKSSLVRLVGTVAVWSHLNGVNKKHEFRSGFSCTYFSELENPGAWPND